MGLGLSYRNPVPGLRGSDIVNKLLQPMSPLCLAKAASCSKISNLRLQEDFLSYYKQLRVKLEIKLKSIWIEFGRDNRKRLKPLKGLTADRRMRKSQYWLDQEPQVLVATQSIVTTEVLER